MKIQLIKPPSPTTTYKKIAKLPLELMAIASALRDRSFPKLLEDKYERNIACEIKNCSISILDYSNKPIESVFNHLSTLNLNNNIIGITSTTPQFSDACSIAKFIKENFNARIILGGAHATLSGKDLRNINIFDAINLGEGIESLSFILGDIVHDIYTPGLGCIYSSFPDSFNEIPNKPKISMNDYPYPANSIDLVDINEYDKSGFTAHNGRIHSPVSLLINSTGCSGKCKFCAIKKIYPYHISRDTHHIANEMIKYIRNGVVLFHIADDTFSEDPQIPLSLARLILKEGIADIEWVFNLKATRRTAKYIKRYGSREYFSLLRTACCRGISIGVESGDQKLLDSLGKGIRLSDVHSITTHAKLSGLGVKWYLMTGLPGQTIDSVYKTIDLFNHSVPTGIAVSFFTPHPGTTYYNSSMISYLSDDLNERIACTEPSERYETTITSPTGTSDMNPGQITFSRKMIIDNFLSRRKIQQ